MFPTKTLGPKLQAVYLHETPFILVEEGYIIFYTRNILAKYGSQNFRQVQAVAAEVEKTIESIENRFPKSSVELSADQFQKLYEYIRANNCTTLKQDKCIVCNGEDLCYCTLPYLKRFPSEEELAGGKANSSQKTTTTTSTPTKKSNKKNLKKNPKDLNTTQSKEEDSPDEILRKLKEVFGDNIQMIRAKDL